MSTEPRAALDRLLAAFELHYETAKEADEHSADLIVAEDKLRDAFFTYDQALFTRFGAELPFDIMDDHDDDDDDEDDIDDDYDDDDEDDIDDDYDDEDEYDSFDLHSDDDN